MAGPRIGVWKRSGLQKSTNNRDVRQPEKPSNSCSAPQPEKSSISRDVPKAHMSSSSRGIQQAHKYINSYDVPHPEKSSNSHDVPKAHVSSSSHGIQRVDKYISSCDVPQPDKSSNSCDVSKSHMSSSNHGIQQGHKYINGRGSLQHHTSGNRYGPQTRVLREEQTYSHFQDEEFPSENPNLEDNLEENIEVSSQQQTETYTSDHQHEENNGSTSHGIPGGRKESRALSGKRKRRLKNDNFILEIDECAGRIIGEDSQHFITKGGCLLRECAIFDGTTWKKQSRLLKTDIINKCTENSNYDSSCGVMVDAINRQLAYQHKNRQYKFHLYYQKFSTKDEAIRHPPNGIKATEWVKLCERFASEEFQKISLRNQKNNSFNVIPPAVGTCSIARMVDEKRRSGQEVSAIDKFKIGHFSTKKNRMVNEKAEEVLNDLLKEEANSSFTPEEICLEKLGHIPGHIKGRSISKRETLATENPRYELELEREKSKALEEQVRLNKEELQLNKEELRQNKEALVKYQKDQDVKMEWMMQELARVSKLQSG